MSSIQIPNLPAAIALNGTEQVEVVQAGVSVRTTTSQIANLAISTSFYGSFYDTTTQTNGGATVANAMTFNSTDLTNGVTVEALGKVRIANAGIYNIQFSAQFDKTDSGDDDAEVWLSVNGNNVANTATILTVHANNGRAVAAWNFFYNFSANDYFQLFWHSTDTDMRLLARAAQVTPDRPEIPSVILTVNSI